MKDVDNAWINPDGKMYRCGYMEHNMWATDYVIDKMCKGDIKKGQDKIAKLNKMEYGGYAYEALNNLGWVRLLWWSDTSGHRIYGRTGNPDLTSSQTDTLFLWCAMNGKNFDDLFKEKR